jgi:ComF family protein
MWQKFSGFVLDLLFPKICFGCGQEGFYICPECLKGIEINRHPKCFICNRRSPDNRICQECGHKTNLTGVFIASSWDNQILRQLIYEYKYRFVKDLAKPLSQIMINYLEADQLIARAPDKLIFTPVPLHRQRLQWRGFNQAELLAKEVANHFEAPVAQLLERSRNTQPQAEIKKQKERKNNIKGAFLLNKTFAPLRAKGAIINNLPLLKEKTVIIVDDITTTGSTLEECAMALKPLRPKEIWGLVLARG